LPSVQTRNTAFTHNLRLSKSQKLLCVFQLELAPGDHATFIPRVNGLAVTLQVVRAVEVGATDLVGLVDGIDI
jgi:hypothetical protein